MNIKDFNAWVEDLCRRFPDTHVWLNSLPSKTGTLTTWKQLLEDYCMTDVRFLLEANRYMQANAGFRVFERELIPQLVANKAKELRWDFERAASTEERAVLMSRTAKSPNQEMAALGKYRQAAIKYNEIKHAQSLGAAEAWLKQQDL